MAEQVSLLYVGNTPLADDVSAAVDRTSSVASMTVVPDVEEGTARAEDEAIDCIVCEFDLPDGTGLDVLRETRAHRPDVPFVLVTDEDFGETALDAIGLGVTDAFDRSSLDATAIAARVISLSEAHRDAALVAELDRVEHEIDRLLVRASCREEIERRVCETFVESDSYLFAWIGVGDPATGTVVPRASAGVEEGYLDDITITTDGEETSKGPTALALETGRPQVMQNIVEDPAYRPWRSEALERGFRSSAAVPFVHGDDCYGVLNIYADRAYAFDEEELSLLTEIGSSVAFAIHTAALRDSLRQNRDRMRAILDATPDAIFIFDAEGVCREIIGGAEQFRGMNHVQFVEQSICDVLPTETAERFGDAIRQTLETGDVQEIEYSLPTREGTAWFEGRMSPLGPDSHEVVLVARDVTRRQQYEKRLRTQRDQLEVLNRLVRHDIRNDMTVILGLGETMRRDIPMDVRADFNRILERGRRVVTLTQTARDFVEMIRGEGEMEVRPTSLMKHLSDEFENARQSYPEADFELVSDVPPVNVQANELLSAVFRNLLMNAVQHNDKDVPRIDVSVGRPDGVVRVRIADNGPGVPEYRRDKVFEQRDEGLLSGDVSIGLYLVQTLVTAYDGRVWIEDNDPEGAVFVVELPVVD